MNWQIREGYKIHILLYHWHGANDIHDGNKDCHVCQLILLSSSFFVRLVGFFFQCLHVIITINVVVFFIFTNVDISVRQERGGFLV